MELNNAKPQNESKFVIWTDFGYGTVEDEKVVTQLNKKKYIKVKKQKKPEEVKDPKVLEAQARAERKNKRKKKKIVREKKERKKKSQVDNSPQPVGLFDDPNAEIEAQVVAESIALAQEEAKKSEADAPAQPEKILEQVAEISSIIKQEAQIVQESMQQLAESEGKVEEVSEEKKEDQKEEDSKEKEEGKESPGKGENEGKEANAEKAEGEKVPESQDSAAEKASESEQKPKEMFQESDVKGDKEDAKEDSKEEDSKAPEKDKQDESKEEQNEEKKQSDQSEEKLEEVVEKAQKSAEEAAELAKDIEEKFEGVGKEKKESDPPKDSENAKEQEKESKPEDNKDDNSKGEDDKAKGERAEDGKDSSDPAKKEEDKKSDDPAEDAKKPEGDQKDSEKKEEVKDNPEPQKEESEYEDVTDPEFDVFNSDDSAEHNRIVQIDYSWGGRGYLQKRCIKKKINVFVKTFYGGRQKHQFRVDINDKIEVLVEKLGDKQEISSYHIIKFVYPMGRIRHLTLNKTFADQGIPENACLVMIGKKEFCWDFQKKGRNITLYNNNLTANKKLETTYETVVANIGFDSGSHYWEVTIDAFVDIDDVYVGICKNNIGLYTPATESGGFWGWIATGDRKFESSSCGRSVNTFGGMCKIGDVVGVLLEFKDELCSLTFYKNKIFVGKAFENIPAGTYYPAVCLYYGEVQLTLNPTAKRPQ